MQTVICVEGREIGNSLKIGEKYLMERLSVYIDEDGDVYAIIYDKNTHCIGFYNLKHFKGVF